MTGPILIREATDRDHAALVRLAERDSASRPPEPLLVAFIRGEARAAISLSTGAFIADPFHRTTELVRLLRLRAAQLVELERPSRGRGLKLRAAAAEGSSPGSAGRAPRRRERMTGDIDTLNPDSPKRVVIVASNPAKSEQTGWPIGFWWSELSHSYWELTERGYHVDVASPDGGRLEADPWSDPRDDSRYSADDLLSLGFINSPEHLKLVEQSKPLADVTLDAYDAVLFVGGQGPMYTFFNDERVRRLLASFYEAGRVTAVICHATCVLLDTRLSSDTLLVEGKTWTGFANSEERFADEYVGRKIQPFWIEDEARKLENTNFIIAGRFKSHAVRDGNLITGQQQYSGAAAARLIIEALGV